jgi:hypothetical protein
VRSPALPVLNFLSHIEARALNDDQKTSSHDMPPTSEPCMLNFRFTSGTEFPESLEGVSLVVHCGACMLNKREMQYRTRHTVDSGVPITNYGITIAYTHGILERSLEVFPNIKKYLNE